MVFKHLQTKKISYLQHMKQALIISFQMLYGSIACFVHAFYPDIYVNTASSIANNIVKLVNEDKEDKEDKEIITTTTNTNINTDVNTTTTTSTNTITPTKYIE